MVNERRSTKQIQAGKRKSRGGLRRRSAARRPPSPARWRRGAGTRTWRWRVSPGPRTHASPARSARNVPRDRTSSPGQNVPGGRTGAARGIGDPDICAPYLAAAAGPRGRRPAERPRSSAARTYATPRGPPGDPAPGGVAARPVGSRDPGTGAACPPRVLSSVPGSPGSWVHHVTGRKNFSASSAAAGRRAAF
jgi:hypothetical protein